MAWGADKQNGGLVVSGGLQDNGGSILRGVRPNGANSDTKMGSNFGGDGGDALADPADGCNRCRSTSTCRCR